MKDLYRSCITYRNGTYDPTPHQVEVALFESRDSLFRVDINDGGDSVSFPMHVVPDLIHLLQAVVNFVEKKGPN